MTQLRTWTGSQWRVMSGGVPTLRAPSNPRDLAITSESGRLDVAWQPPYDAGGTALTGYQLTVSPGGITQNLAASSISTSITGLSNGTPYALTLIAMNSIGNSPSLQAVASPTGPWVLGGTGSLAGAPAGWGGNSATNNLRGAYAATEPPAGITNGYQMNASYCGVLPVMQAQNKDYADLTPITSNGTFLDKTGQPSGTMTYDPLTGAASINVTRNGAILEYLDIPGQIFVSANNVIVRYCRLDGRPVVTANSYLIKTYSQFTGLIVQYCELIGGPNITSLMAPYGEYTARYNDAWNIGFDAFKVGSNTLLEFNWVHGLNKGPGAHADATQWTAGDNIYIRYNRFDLYTGLENEESYQLADHANGATIVGKMTGHGSWFAFDDNYADGCTYNIRAGQVSPDPKGWTTQHAYWRRNRIGRKFAFGPIDNDAQASADQIVDDSNVWHESGPTYRYNTRTGIWHHSVPVVANTSVKGWPATDFDPVT
jgi:hypothetical protein